MILEHLDEGCLEITPQLLLELIHVTTELLESVDALGLVKQV